MKKSVILVLIISILLVSVISVNLVSAGLLGDIWNKITGRAVGNETEATNETEPEPEPEPQPERQCEEGKSKNHVCEDGTEVSWCGCENGMWVCEISPENECPEEEEPEICAAKIEINFDKTGYAAGDSFKAEVGVFDSQGNSIPNYPFYVRMYDDRWHTPDLQKTGADGYFRDSGKTPKKTIRGVTRGIFNAYTKETASCGSVEDTIELRLEEPEPVPCGIGKCVPEPECRDRVRMCGGDCPPCPENKTKGEIFYACSGCELEGKCYPMGYRKKGEYCSEDYEFVSQLEADSFCENSFECKTNLCIDGECLSAGLWRKIIRWFERIFGPGPEPPKPPQIVECSELLIEKNIGDYEYVESVYGHKDHQVALYSEDGEQIDIVKCCVAVYENPDGTEGGGIVCPFDNRKDLENSLYWLSKKEDIILGEDYKGQKVYRGGGPEPEVIVWTSNAYIIASGGGPGEGPLPEDVADAYLDKYPNNLGEIEIPESPELVECSGLLIKEKLGNYSYVESMYSDDSRDNPPIFSEEGERIGFAKCCMARYKNLNGQVQGAMVCPYDNRQYAENFVKLVGKNPEGEMADFTWGEYKGERVYTASQDLKRVLIWVHENYLVGAGSLGEPEPEGSGDFEEEFADAYIAKYPSDLGEII